MIGLVVILVCICLIVMILEGLLAGDGKHHIVHVEHPPPGETNGNVIHHNNESKPCWQTSKVDVIEYCHQCEGTVEPKLKETCNKTGWVERVKCRSSNVSVVRSCPLPSSAPFWRFELFMVAISFLSAYFCYRRESFLEGKAFDRINKQVSCGV